MWLSGALPRSTPSRVHDRPSDAAEQPLLREVDRALDRLEVRDESVLAAVSGGIDSVVMLDLLTSLSRSRGLRIAVATVDHGLRGAEAEEDVRFVGALAQARGLPFLCEHVDTSSIRGRSTGRRRPTIQEAARRARYDALERAADRAGATRIATAHQRDDQAETVLMRLLRGSGPDGLGGIPEASPDGRIVRPLLGASRAEIRRHAQDHQLSWREDPTNRNPRYARNRLRHRWLPGLSREFNPRLLRSLAQLAEVHRRDAEWIEQLVAAEADLRLVRDGHDVAIRRAGWEELPTALARRLIHRLWREQAGAREITRERVDRACEFVARGRTGAMLELPGGLELVARRDSVLLRRAGERDAAC